MSHKYFAAGKEGDFVAVEVEKALHGRGKGRIPGHGVRD